MKRSQKSEKRRIFEAFFTACHIVNGIFLWYGKLVKIY